MAESCTLSSLRGDTGLSEAAEGSFLLSERRWGPLFPSGKPALFHLRYSLIKTSVVNVR